jgi:iron complex outermembrane receptor protein
MQDGLNIVSTTEYAAEQFDQMQVLYGLAGTLFGPGNPAGIFNAVSKRPTDNRFYRFFFSSATGPSYLALLDLAGPVDKVHRVKYRFNLLNDRGNYYTPISSWLRRLEVASVDWQINKKTVLETNFSNYHYKVLGLPATFALATNALGVPLAFPAPLDGSSSAYALGYAGNVDDTLTTSFHLKHQFSQAWKLDTGMLYQIADRQSRGATFTLAAPPNPTGIYTATTGSTSASRFTLTSYLGTLSGRVKTGFIQHDLSFGLRGFYWDNFNPIKGSTITLGKASLQHPIVFPAPAYPNFRTRYESANTTQQSFTLGDTVTFSPKWSVMLTASMNHLTNTNWSIVGVNTNVTIRGIETSSTNVFKPTFSGSLLYNPVKALTFYGTFANSEQVGDVAPAGNTNVNDILPPYLSKQYEVGSKLGVGRTLWTLDTFQVQRPFDYSETLPGNKIPTYVMSGIQRNRGLEFMVDGNVAPHLRVLGGFTWLDALILNSATVANNDKQVVGLPRITMNVLAKYQIPWVPKLVVNLNSRFLTRQATDNADINWVKDYAVFDTGASYWTKLWRFPTIFRLEVTNIANQRYWDNIVPGGLTGYSGAGNATASPGIPRMARATLQMNF